MMNPIKWLKYRRRVRFFMKHWQFSRKYAEIMAGKTEW